MKNPKNTPETTSETISDIDQGIETKETHEPKAKETFYKGGTEVTKTEHETRQRTAELAKSIEKKTQTNSVPNKQTLTDKLLTEAKKAAASRLNPDTSKHEQLFAELNDIVGGLDHFGPNRTCTTWQSLNA